MERFRGGLRSEAPSPSSSEKYLPTTLLETGVGSDNGIDQGMQGTEEKGILPGGLRQKLPYGVALELNFKE